MKNMKPIVVQTTLSFDHRGTIIPYDIWQTDPDKIPTRILFLGAAQMGMVASWVAEHCPAGTLLVQGLPHWLVTDEDISGFAITYVDEAFRALMGRYALDKIDILVESQAAPSVIKLFTKKEYSDHLGNLILIQPLGLNSAAFTSINDPFSLFLRRTAQNAKHQLPQLFDSKLYYNTRQLAKHLKLRDPMFRAHYTTGLKQDIAAALKALHDSGDYTISVICGANDKLFPPEEIAQTLEKYKINVQVQQIPGVPHSPLATRHGLKLLRAAFAQLQ